MSDVALVTANFGGIDEPKALPAHPGIDAFYYTDLSDIAPDVAGTWTRVVEPDYPRHDFGPRLRAKYFKLQLHRLDEVHDHRWLAWADASLEIHRLDVLLEHAAALARLPEHRRMLAIPHPDRATVREEFEFVERLMAEGHPGMLVRYGNERMAEQMAWYGARGWNVHAKLWCGGFWMLENSPVHRAMLNDWWDQNLRFGIMDQISLPVILERHGVEPVALDINLWQNDLFAFRGHQRRM